MTQIKSEVIAYMTRAMVSSIVGEVSATPKPGLVDRSNSGAHRDMNFSTFLDSTTAITPYLQKMAYTGCVWDSSPQDLFLHLRPLGCDAEQAMFSVTNHVNTHKGMIFSMGLLAAAAGYYYQQHACFNSEEILLFCGEMAGPAIQNDFAKIDPAHPKTHGEHLFAAYGIRGIRGEVQNGFPSVRKISLPVLKRLVQEHSEWNDLFVQTLFFLMANVEDSNILYRSDIETMRYVNLSAQDALQSGGIYTKEGQEKILRMDCDFIQKNISPGGCADLLAVTVFAYLLDQYAP